MVQWHETRFNYIFVPIPPPYWNISLGTKYEIKLRAKTLRRIKMAPRTRIVMELKRNLSLAAYLPARKTYLERKRRYLQTRRVHGFPNSLVLFNLICIEVDVLTLYLNFEIREKMNTILYFIALIPLKSPLLPSGSHIVSCFSAQAEIPFRLHEYSMC